MTTAREFTTYVSKMAERDPETVDLFVQMSLFNALADQIEQARPVLDARVDEVLSKQAGLARRSLLRRTAVSKNLEEDPDLALTLAVIEAYVSKSGLFGSALSAFNEKHQRGAKGQFIHMEIDHNQSNGQKPDDRHRDAHNQAQNLVTEAKGQGLVDDSTPLKLHYKRMDAKGKVLNDKAIPVHADSRPGSLKADLDANTAGDSKLLLRAVSFKRKNIPIGTGEHAPERRAALDAMMTFTAPANAARLSRNLPLDDKGADWDRRGADWNRPGSWDDRKIYRRMNLTGSALAAATVPGSTLNSAAHLTRLVGNLGPEAEKVLGPGLRRTAYRYRGTERRPDEGAVHQLVRANRAAATVIADPTQMAQVYDRSIASDKRTDPAEGAAGFWATQHNDMTPDQLAMRVRGDTMAASLVQSRALVDINAAALSLESGELPPSQGVLIDSQGRLFSQAQGYNGDHYLPFDLKNLRGLAGGQYVRTRAAGGLTTEDVYTGLLAGARQVQVVSNSGVFTMEFDPSIRGGRRYSDKAVRMINRYGKLLETIDSGKIMQRDIAPSEKAKLRTEARSLSRGGDDEAQLYTRMLNDARTNQEAPDEEEYAREAAAQVDEAISHGNRMSRQQRAQAIHETTQEMLSEVKDNQVRRLALDGKGYGAAMAALKQEFPFYIRSASYETLPEFLGRRRQAPEGAPRGGPRDTGFVERGQTNPSRATGAPRYNLKRKPESVGDAGVVADRQNQPSGQGALTDRERARARALGEDKPIPLNELVKPGTPLARAMAQRAGVLVKVVQQWGADEPADAPGFHRDDDMAMGEGARRFLHHRLIGEAKGDTQKFVDWTLTKATPEQRDMLLEGIDDIEALVSSQPTPVQNEFTSGAGMAQWGSRLAELKALIESADPFAPKTGDMATAQPSLEHARPQAFPDIVALGSDPDAYEAYRKKEGIAFSDVVDHVARSTPRETADSISDKLDELASLSPASTEAIRLKHAVETQQKAWAFHVAHDIAEKITEAIGTKGGATASGASPKVPSGSLKKSLSGSSPRRDPSRPTLLQLVDDLSKRLQLE